MSRFYLKETDARGRNGPFRAQTASLDFATGTVRLYLYSKQSAEHAPVEIGPSPQDLATLVRGISDFVAVELPQREAWTLDSLAQVLADVGLALDPETFLAADPRPSTGNPDQDRRLEFWVSQVVALRTYRATYLQHLQSPPELEMPEAEMPDLTR